METGGSLPRLQKLPSYPCTDPHQSNPRLSSPFQKIHLKSIFPSKVGLPSGYFLSVPPSPPKTLYAPLPRTYYMPYPSHSSQFDQMNRSLGSTFCSFLYSPVTPSLLGPNTLLNTLFSNTVNLLSSLNESDQISHPYKTTGKMIFLCNLVFTFLDIKLGERNILHWIPWLESALNFFLNRILIC